MYNVLHISVNVLIFFRLFCETAIVSYVSAKKNSTETIAVEFFFAGNWPELILLLMHEV